MMLFWSNYHTHSRFCDGHGELEDYVSEAIKNDIHYLGFTAHAPLPFETDWNMKEKDFEDYKNTILDLREKYKDQISILLGLEVDYIPGVVHPLSESVKSRGLDYVLGSVHFLDSFKDGRRWTVDYSEEEFESGLRDIFDNDIKAAVQRYYSVVREMILNYPPDIIGHLDLIKKSNRNNKYFSEDEPWYRLAVLETLDAIAGSDCVLEINTGGIVRRRTDSLYPSDWILRECLNLEIPLTINSDAHRPDGITGYYEETRNILRKIGYKKMNHLTSNGWIEQEL